MKIVSGGQTGVDRGALDAAIALGIDHGGWCPRGRLSEDGRIPDAYELQETDSSEYPVRTQRNLVDSDATLILCHGTPRGGTGLTLHLAQRHGRPVLVVDLDQPDPIEAIRRWLRDQQVATLNVAGPRESQSPGIAARAADLLKDILSM